MPVHSMKLSETPYSGSGTQRKHEFILTCDGMSDDEVFDWLLEPNATFTGVIQRPGSDALITSLPPGETPIYLVYSARDLTDLEYQLVRDCDPEYYRITATYDSPDSGSGGNIEPKLGPDGITVSFELAPENELIRQSLETLQDYPPTGGVPAPFAPVMNQAINVQKDGTVDGVQMPSSPHQVTYSFTQAAAWWTPAKRLELSRAVGKVNSVTMNVGGIGYAAGEVRFLGASGQISNQGNSTIELTFGVIENRVGITIAGIDETRGGTVPNGIVKDGWDYLWVLYGDGENAGKRNAKPRGAYVERILYRTDLNALFS